MATHRSMKDETTEDDTGTNNTQDDQVDGGLPDEVLMKIMAASGGLRPAHDGGDRVFLKPPAGARGVESGDLLLPVGLPKDSGTAGKIEEHGQVSEKMTPHHASSTAGITSTTNASGQQMVAAGLFLPQDQATEVPKPPPLRSSHATQSLPGAFAERGIGSGQNDLSTGNRGQGSSRSIPQRPSRQDETETPTAVQVEDEEAPDLPRATHVPFSSKRGRPNQDRHSYILTAFVLVGIILVVVLILVIGLLVNKADAPHSELNSTIPQGNTSTAGPLSTNEYLMSVLPEHSLYAISEEPESPQALAFEWLLNDTDSLGNTTDASILVDRRIHQRYALATLYYATGGDHWFHNDHWLNHTTHECTWYSEIRNRLFQPQPPLCPGFNTSTTENPANTGVITNLGLARNNLIGTLPLELMMMTSLQTLSLGFNVHLQGPIPTAIGNLTALEGLWIHSVQQGGTIPSSIGMLTNLRAISLAGNDHVGSLPSELVQLTNVESLLLGSNPRLTGSINPLMKMRKLRYLSLDRNDHTGMSFWEMFKCFAPTSFFLTNYLARCYLIGTIPEEFSEFSILEWFLVAENRLRGTIPTSLGRLTNIVMASLHTNQLEGALPTELGLWTSCTLLSLRNNSFESTIPSELGQLSKLNVSLSIGNNPRLHESIPSQLGLLTNLYEFILANNSHTGQIPSEFGMLRALGKLDLASNALSGTIPTSVAALVRPSQQEGNKSLLYFFDVSENQLTGVVPEGLCDINATCIPHPLRKPCLPTEGPYLSFADTDLLCDCGCTGKIQ